MEYMLDGIISIFNVCELPYNPPDSKLEPQSISLGENILDYMQSITMDDVCTKICPIGKDGLTLTGSTFYDAGNFISDEYLIKKYGVVEQIKTYEEIDNVPDLRRAAENEMWAYRSAEFASFEISAFDLSLLNPELEPIQIGRGYYVKSLPHGVNDIFACTNAYIDISNPANSKYKFDNLALKRSRDRNYLTYQTSKTNRISTPMPQEKPTKIVKKSSNKVVQEFADYKVIIEAEGEGDERTNFKRTIIGNETPPMPESYIST